MKYPGGYQIIDLGGLNLGNTAKPIPFEPWGYASKMKKPVFISNFNENLYYFGSPILLHSMYDTADAPATGFYEVLTDNDGKPTINIKVELDLENKTATIEVVDLT